MSEQDELLLTREEYIRALTARGLPEVCAVYDEDTIAGLEAQLAKAKQHTQELLLEYSKGAHLDKDGFFWHFEIPVEILKKEFPNVGW